ncbi:unnamed protein product [Polarella glacialis]|uniref:Uncharacterized protein n=1 Tax=Polarella glacialis TaxID=89957 RepID=A0A813L1W2_POLGL|nr:unnamed protein product [Polarella glacialis]
MCFWLKCCKRQVGGVFHPSDRVCPVLLQAKVIRPMVSCLARVLLLPAAVMAATSFQTEYDGIGDLPSSTAKRQTSGWKPDDSSGKYPVYMFLLGTGDIFENDYNAVDYLTSYMACKGFIAAVPDYPNKAFCMRTCRDGECEASLLGMFGMTEPQGKIGQPEKARSVKKALDVLCAMPEADCPLFQATVKEHGCHLDCHLSTIVSLPSCL